MHVRAGDTQVPIRPTWRSFVLSMLTGSMYQLYWIVAVGRELAALGAAPRIPAPALAAMVVVSQVVVLAIAAIGATSALALVAAVGALFVGSLAMVVLAGSIFELQRRVAVSRPADARLAVVLFVVGCGIGAVGVLPHDGLPISTRMVDVLVTGLVLPFWLLYLQHQLNGALLRMDPTSEDEDLFGGATTGDATQQLMRARLAEWHRSRARITEQDLTPWVTFGLMATCTLVFAWQLLAFGLVPTLPEMQDAGASTMTLVRDGEAWRLFTQHFVHFTVDHWAFNMFALAMTGWVVERTVGHRTTLAVMAASLAGATIATWFLGPVLYGPAAEVVTSGGESGIGFGMMGALLAIDPHGRTQTGQFARWLGAIGIVSSLAPGVGILAHAGGFAGGFIAVRLLYRTTFELPTSLDVQVVGSVGHAADVLPVPPSAFEVVPPPAHPPAVVAPPALPPVDRRG